MLKTKFLVTVSNKDDYVNYDMLTIKELRHFLKSGILFQGLVESVPLYSHFMPILAMFIPFSPFIRGLFSIMQTGDIADVRYIMANKKRGCTRISYVMRSESGEIMHERTQGKQGGRY